MCRFLQRSYLLLAVVSIIILPVSLAAQTYRGAISGTLTDPSGSIVQGAQVDLLSQATSLHRETVTNAAGIYDFPALPLGVYNVSISHEGFRSFQLVNVELSVGQPRTIDVRLEVGTVSGSVQVVASADPLNRSTAEVGGLVDADQIKVFFFMIRRPARFTLFASGALSNG